MFVERVHAVHRIQREMDAALQRTENVVGHAIGYKIKRGQTTTELALVALVQEKVQAARLPSSQLLPRQVDDVPLDVVAVGRVMAQQGPRGRHRPQVPGGVSIGHPRITAGTLGMRVRDRRSGEILLLSNNHVLANVNEAARGAEIIQPGHIDGGRLPGDRVALLERYLPLTFLDQPMPTGNSPGASLPGPFPEPLPGQIPGPLPGQLPAAPAQRRGCGRALHAVASVFRKGPGFGAPAPGRSPEPPVFSYNNRLDAALARPLDAAMFPNAIQGIGPILGSREAVLGLRVRKHGRTTGLTSGRIVLINATVKVSYITSRGMRSANFVGQIGTEAISEGGDSGSILVEEGSNLAVGLLFAGSNTRSFYTPIQTALDLLDVRIG